jgi:hypothetical protein
MAAVNVDNFNLLDRIPLQQLLVRQQYELKAKKLSNKAKTGTFAESVEKAMQQVPICLGTNKLIDP